MADDPALPERWSDVENVVWKTDIPGGGWSSPIVWDDHIFVTSTVPDREETKPPKGLYDPGDENGKMRSTATHRWMIYDIDFKTGRIRWEHELAKAMPQRPAPREEQLLPRRRR